MIHGLASRAKTITKLNLSKQVQTKLLRGSLHPGLRRVKA